MSRLSTNSRVYRVGRGLYAKLLYLINAPAQRLLSVVNGTARDLAIVLQQAVEQEKLSA